MRLWNFGVSIVILALALSCWHFGDWTGGPENEGMDGTCQGLQQMAAYGLALVLSACSIATLFVRKRHITGWIETAVTESKSVPPGTEMTRPGKEFDRLLD
jgi:hypothetical protein